MRNAVHPARGRCPDGASGRATASALGSRVARGRTSQGPSVPASTRPARGAVDPTEARE